MIEPPNRDIGDVDDIGSWCWRWRCRRPCRLLSNFFVLREIWKIRRATASVNHVESGVHPALTSARAIGLAIARASPIAPRGNAKRSRKAFVAFLICATNSGGDGMAEKLKWRRLKGLEVRWLCFCFFVYVKYFNSNVVFKNLKINLYNE